MQPNPVVSVIVANYNGARHLAASLKALTRQSLAAIEIIVIDDASSDDSVTVALEAAKADPRIVVVTAGTNGGPAAARNLGLARATGDWIAIVDSDDLVHAKRLEILVAKAEATHADIIADDLFVFYDDASPPHTFLQGAWRAEGGIVSLARYVKENAIFSFKPALGFLKPLFRRGALERFCLKYDENLRIGEDFDLVMRGLAAGLTFWIEPQPLYLYRKHAHSISHRLSNDDIERMLKADRAFIAAEAARGRDLKPLFKTRHASLQRAATWNELVDYLKTRRFGAAAQSVIETPSLLPLCFLPVKARLKRFMTYAKNAVSSLASSQTPKDRKKSICLISRQRLVAGTTGSSRYVLSLMKTLQKAGYDIHLIHPSPNVFGRMPLMVGAKGLSPFKSVSVRGGIVVGRFIIALNIGVFAGFVRGACAVAARKFGITLPDQPAPYSVSAPWVAKDYVFLSKHSRAKTDTVICDYAFQTDALAYMARLDAKSFVIMHDLISSRQEQFSRIQQTDTLPSITEREELRLLTGADAIIAIQEDEAAYIRARAAGHTVVCAPVAFETASLAHPGDPSMLLFVGSKTPPNEIGLNWFLRDVWPLLHAQSPCLKLIVAGSVCRSIGAVPANVELRGTVRDLQPLYEAAGVVISPLLAGSGLKIKLIEALSYGKAIVSTLPTVEGVKAIVEDAVMIADDSHAFARAIITLIRDDDLRAHKANRALDIAQKNFTADVCYQEMLGLFNAPALKSSNLPRIENDQDFALDDSAQIERA